MFAVRRSRRSSQQRIRHVYRRQRPSPLPSRTTKCRHQPSSVRTMTEKGGAQQGYSECTGQGSDDDLGPCCVLPSKTNWSEQPSRPHRTRVLDPEGAAMLDHTSKITSAELAGFMPAFEAQLRQDLRNYAVELRQLANTLPNGVREHDLRRLSGRIRATADQVERQRSVDDG
jgi:hypothetical protein